MKTLSQNRKIAISTIAVFLASFCFVVVFLTESEQSAEFGKTDVMGAEEDNGIVFSTDAEGEFLGASGPFCQLIDKPCTSIEEYRLFDFINSDDLSEFASVHAKLLQEGKPAKGLGPFRFEDENENSALLLLNAVPQEEEGKILKIIFSARDLTEHIKNLSKEEAEKKIEEVEVLREEEEVLPEKEEALPEEEKKDDDGSKDSSWLERFYPKKPSKLLVEKA